MNNNRVANNFMLDAIQEWGQPEEKRIAAVQAVVDAAGFNARATCFPVFGGIWPRGCEGPDGEAATQWLKNLTTKLKRGEYNSEVRQIVEAIDARTRSECQGNMGTKE